MDIAYLIVTYLSAGLGLASLWTTIGRLRSLRPTSGRAGVLPSVSVLIPARNEADVIVTSLNAIQAIDYPDLEVLVLDDRSIDNTAEMVRTHGGRRVRLLRGKTPPAGWTGKNFACHQLAAAATGEYLLFLDADCQLSPQAVTRMIGHLIGQNLDLVSVVPSSVSSSFLEELTNPMTSLFLHALQPLGWLMEHFPASRPVYGMCILIKHSFYNYIGGHEAAKSNPIEATTLARRVSQHGSYQTIAMPEFVSVQHHGTAGQLIHNQLRQLYSLLQWRRGVTLALAAGILLLGVLPFAIIPYAVYVQPALIIPCLIAGLAFYANRLVVARYFGERILPSLLYPLSLLLFTGLILSSLAYHEFGQVRWKGSRLRKD